MSDIVRASESEDGQTVEVQAGGTLELQLQENPTNGYRWTLSPPPACLSLVDDAFTPPAVLVPGRPGDHTWRFLAVGPGTGTLQLASARSWDPTPGRHYTLHIVVPTDRAITR
jgi:inhibitor of cysteine peptidase